MPKQDMSPNHFRSILPHALSLIGFYLLVLVYFSPLVFDDKIIFQNDILQWEGGAKEILDHREATGEQLLWTNRLFGGMPAYLVSLEVPGDITNAVLKGISLGLPHPVNSLFIGMIGMYILLLSFRIRPSIAALGAIAFAFNTFHLISLDAGHNAKIWAICLIPLIFTGMHLVFERKTLLGMALFAFALMLQLKFNHLQITYYTLLIILIYGIPRLIQGLRRQQAPQMGATIGVLVLAAGIAFGANSTRIATVLEYGTYSTRGAANLPGEQQEGESGLGKAYAFNWSQGKLETFTLLVPYLYGGGSMEALRPDSQSEQVLRQQGADGAQIRGFTSGAPTYWGDQPGTGGPIYGGALMLGLFILGLLFAEKNYRWIFLGMALTGIVLALGANLSSVNYFLFDYLPGYNKFRAVTMALSITLFAIPVLGALGAEQFLAGSYPEKKRYQGLAIMVAVPLVFLLFGALFLDFRGKVDGNLPDWLVDALRADRRSLFLRSAFSSLLMILGSAALLWAIWKNKLQSEIGIGLMVLILTVDLWIINKRYLGEEAMRTSPAASFFSETPADKKIAEDKGYFRVFNLENPFNEARTSYRFASIGGYHGAKMRRYQELIEVGISPEIDNFILAAQEGQFNYQDLPILNMLNTRYLMAGRSEQNVFRNPRALGPAWFPREVVHVSSAQEEMEKLTRMNTATVAVMDTRQQEALSPGAGTLELLDSRPDRLRYAAKVEKAGLAVFSEIHYPEGWIAEVNGAELPIYRVNYLLRGLNLPEGSYEISMRFEPKSYFGTKTLLVVFQYLSVLLLLGALVVDLRSKAKTHAA